MTPTSRYDRTRRSLHAVAELLLAGPAYRTAESIRLTVEPDGFATVPMDGPVRRLHVRAGEDGVDLVVDPGSDEGGMEGPNAHHHVPLSGTYAEVARIAGIDPGAPEDLYPDHADAGVDDEIALDPADVRSIVDGFAAADAALRAFTEGAAGAPEPVLWPEHFDVGISLDEVNYGVSAGDSAIAVPYAYVGPWQPREGAFWNQSFGAARPLDELAPSGGSGSTLVAALVEFFRAGRAAAAADPPRT